MALASSSFLSRQGADAKLPCCEAKSNLQSAVHDSLYAIAQQMRDIDPMLIQCWFTVHYAGPALNQQFTYG